MSLILSARYVHIPRIARRCDECGTLLGPHIYIYGSAHETGIPSAMRLCVQCCTQSTEPKIRAAVAQAATHADAIGAEAARLAAWNATMKNETHA